MVKCLILYAIVFMSNNPANPFMYIQIEQQMLGARKNKKQYLEGQLFKHHYLKEKRIC